MNSPMHEDGESDNEARSSQKRPASEVVQPRTRTTKEPKGGALKRRRTDDKMEVDQSDKEEEEEEEEASESESEASTPSKSKTTANRRTSKKGKQKTARTSSSSSSAAENVRICSFFHFDFRSDNNTTDR